MRALRRFTVRAQLPPALAPLQTLATNLRWSWHPPTLDLFATLDPEAWERAGHDPVRLLGEIPTAKLAELAADAETVVTIRELADDLAEYLAEPRWYQGEREDDPSLPAAIGYFSMEFGVSEVLPNYSGGLGVLAGDHLKASSDLGLPLIGVGLLYRSGYFRQSLSLDGWQLETYPVLDPQGLPLQLLVWPETGSADAPPGAAGEQVLVEIAMPAGKLLKARVWQAAVGRVPLLMLDSDIEENDPDLRGVTDRLYGGDQDQRIRQEILVGIGGVRAVRAYCAITGHPQPEVFHTNEGHAGYLGLERIRELCASPGLTFDEALATVRAGTVFTTHTPVPAGIDRFPVDMVRHYFHQDLLPGVPTDRVLALGAEDNPNMFNMAHMGLRLAQRANGVSKLHGAVSRGMFGGLWDGFDADEVPIGSVTNGVHGNTWEAREVAVLLGEPDHRPRGGQRQRALVAAQRPARAAGRGGAPPRAGGVAAARRLAAGAGLDRARVRPGRAHRRVRPARADLQAAHAHAARQGPAARPAAGPAAARAARRRGQVAPGRRRRQGAHPGDRPLRRRPGGAPPHRVPARLRHVDGPLPLLGLRRVAEQPAAAAGGVRHVGDEVGAQRRAQPVDPRRLVGRALRRPQRLGDPHRRRHRRPAPARRPRGQRAVRAARHPGGARVLRPHRRTCRSGGWRWCATRSTTLRPAVQATRMVREYADGLYAPAARAAAAVAADGYAGRQGDRRVPGAPGPVVDARRGDRASTPPGCRTPRSWGRR